MAVEHTCRMCGLTFMGRKNASICSSGCRRYFNTKRTREWDEKNPSSAAERSARWRANNADKVRASKKAWREKNPGYMQEYLKKYYTENSELIKARSKAWAEHNIERARHTSNQSAKRYYRRHVEECAQASRERRQRKAKVNNNILINKLTQEMENHAV